VKVAVPNRAREINPALLDRKKIKRALVRRVFWEFFCYMDPGVIKCWWQEDAAGHLQEFYEDMVAGRWPKLVFAAPPQHGKSRLIVYFIAWCFGRDPSLRTFYASVSDALGVRANLQLQRIFDSARFKWAFPRTRICGEQVVTQAGKPRRNSAVLEMAGWQGYFRNTTVRGAIVGESMDLGVIDDPIKGREEAESKTIRDKTWLWFNDDFMTRFSKKAGMLVIATRWHLDDPTGRLLKHRNDVKVVTYAAIAERDEEHRKEGEPLFPEIKPLAMLEEFRGGMTAPSWLALYQQRPTPREGSIIKGEWFVNEYCERSADPLYVLQSWDTASKPQERNDPSVCGTFGVFKDHVELWHVFVARLDIVDLVEAMIRLAEEENPTEVLIEDKSSGQQAIQILRRTTDLPVVPFNPGRLDKITRAEAEASYIQAGNLWLPKAQPPWLKPYLDEVTTFPDSAWKDQVDMTSQALRRIREKRKRSRGPAGPPAGGTKRSSRRP